MSAMDFLPESRSLRSLRNAVQACQGCELYLRATQAVFGQGPATAAIALVGEQPGHEEDLQGLPFVGPAGIRLDQALAAAGLHRDHLYLTNAVKHFRWEERGPRRLHKQPSARQVRACEPWLEAEFAAIKAKVIVSLGAIAAKVILGPDFKLTLSRGKTFQADNKQIIATWHPSAILRAPDRTRREQMFEELVSDLKLAATLAEK